MGPHSTSKLRIYISWVLLAFVSAVIFFIYAAFGQIPVEIRALAVPVRYSFVSTSLLILVLFYFILRLPGWWSIILTFAVGGALFGLALGGLWASGQSEPYVVSGLIPYNDAATYSIDANRLVDGSRLSAASSRRPFFIGMLGAVLKLTGRNLQQATAVFIFLLAVSCVYLVLEIRRIHGAVPAAGSLWIIFLFARRFAGTTMTETLGLTFGVLGLTFLLSGANGRNLFKLMAGLFLLSVALNIRAGAFFILPVLIVWIGWLLREKYLFNWKATGLAILAVILAFALNSFVLRIIGVPGGMLFGNFSESLYGLAAGGERWAEVYNRHPELLQMTETIKYQEIYRLSFELIRSNPLNLWQGMLHQWSLLFSQTWFSVFAYVGGEDIAGNRFVHWALYGLCIAALIQAFRKWKDPTNSFLLVAIFGIFISVPFVPPGDAHKMRAFAATIPILALFPAFGAGWLVSLIPWKPLRDTSQMPDTPGLGTFTSLVTFFMICAPLITIATAVPPAVQTFSCQPGEEPVSLHYAEGNEVRLIREEVLQLDWLPEFHFGRYKIFIHNLPNDEAINILSKVEPPATLMLSYDIPTGKRVWLLGRTDQMPADHGIVNVCGNYLDTKDPDLIRYGFYYPRQIQLAREN